MTTRSQVRYLCQTAIILMAVFFGACSSDKIADESETNAAQHQRKVRFVGNYNKEFNDLHELHIVAATNRGIEPMHTKADTANYGKKELLRIPDETELYKTYELTHSVPFLVPEAAQLLMDIAYNFRDSLHTKELPLYRLYLTSVTRPVEDIGKLSERNINASSNSAHQYATTFDISWKRFEQVDNDTLRQLPPERLKFILGQVLYDLRENERCYVKHERRQACFHITVR